MGQTVWRAGFTCLRNSCLAALAAALTCQPSQAQSRQTDAELEALIPDAAVAEPERWAGANTDATAAADAPAPPEPDRLAPLDENSPDFTVTWPQQDLAAPAAEALALEPDGSATLAASDAGEGGAEGAGIITVISPRVALVWPHDLPDFPERKAFEQRFRDLSAIEQLSGKGEGGIAQLAVRARSDSQLLNQLLRIYGYYDADVFQTVAGAQSELKDAGEDGAADAPTIRFEIATGVRYRFGRIDLGQLDNAGEQGARLRESFAIRQGEFLSTDRILTERGKLDIALGESGHVFASLGEPDLLIDHGRDEGDLSLPVKPGGAYRFGPIVSAQPRFLSGRHLQDIARFDPGDLYQRSMVDDLQRAILATGLVASVTITPRETRAPAGLAQGEVALDVDLAKAPLRTIAGSLGYESGEGPRAEASWEHRNLFPSEGMLRLRAVGGLNEQLLGATFRRNNFKGRDRVLTLDVTANDVQRDAYDARTITLSGSYERLTTLLFQKPWTWSAGFELAVSNEREGSVAGMTPQRNTYYTAALPLRAAWDSSDNLLDPRQGLRAALRISPEVSREDKRTATYARIQADASWYQPLTKGVVIAARARLGSIVGAGIDRIAPSRRFFAGGGGSVRGYGFQQIGPHDTLGEPSGGRSLNEFSLEARVKTGLLGGAVTVVPFVDAGQVYESITPSLRSMRYGAGVGLRYNTGFGPIRVDVATPINRQKGENRIGVYVALGQSF